MSPFIAKRVWDLKPFAVRLVSCKKCNLYFFNPRLEPEEESRLYSGYRGPEYQKMRRAFEPWYTPRFNASITAPEFLKVRKAKVTEILGANLAGKMPSKILDFGGAQGELVQNLLPGATPYVYDVSGVAPLEGVQVCADLESCRSHDFDLIISSNVLEHVGSPREIVRQMRGVAGAGTKLWVEVPFESPSSGTLLARRFIQQLVLLALRPRVAFWLAKPGMLSLMHEHVNFFGLPALQSLLASSGWEVANSGTYDLNGPLGRQSWAWALASAV